MKLPNFIIGGVMKSGTTFLHNLLINHPEIKMIERNMDHAYFDDDRIYIRGDNWYENLFNQVSHYKGEFTIGQTSADCAFNPKSVDRILRYNQNTKLIFVLRHPIDRAYSLYWHQYSMAREHRRFESAISREARRINKSYYNFKNFSYIERSRYKKQFDCILDRVPPENILMLDFISLTQNTKDSINAILRFLNVSEVSDKEDLDFSNLPKNSARIPLNLLIVKLSAALQFLGLIGLGRRLVNMFSYEKRPMKMASKTRDFLEVELSEDIVFYNTIRDDFSKKLKI